MLNNKIGYSHACTTITEQSCLTLVKSPLALSLGIVQETRSGRGCTWQMLMVVSLFFPFLPQEMIIDKVNGQPVPRYLIYDIIKFNVSDRVDAEPAAARRHAAFLTTLKRPR